VALYEPLTAAASYTYAARRSRPPICANRVGNSNPCSRSRRHVKHYSHVRAVSASLTANGAISRHCRRAVRGTSPGATEFRTWAIPTRTRLSGDAQVPRPPPTIRCLLDLRSTAGSSRRSRAKVQTRSKGIVEPVGMWPQSARERCRHRRAKWRQCRKVSKWEPEPCSFRKTLSCGTFALVPA
jgi:hypothetical protein